MLRVIRNIHELQRFPRIIRTHIQFLFYDAYPSVFVSLMYLINLYFQIISGTNIECEFFFNEK